MSRRDAEPALPDVHTELAELTAALHALLVGQRARGAVDEPVDAAEPAADDALLAALDAAAAAAPEPAPEVTPEPEPAVEVEPPPRQGLWDTLATGARSTRTPTHHDDGVGAAGLARIREDLGDCTRCGLCAGRTQVVFGVGDPEADLMVVGEGPGEQEDLKGEPFVGPAGQMLDRMLANVVGLQRSQVYIANIVKCRPPKNRNPEPVEAATCKPFLFRQIEAVQPRLILVLGGVALEHLLGVKGILRNRGRETRLGAVPVIPTLHPAYLLRKPDDKRLSFEDLKLARRRYDELGGRR
ncbi:MAG: uracil-DNA glycosylase [Alphaproteobacteria bacterium]|nr:uracil-DNA glycosylase [Alphaproteobacteria bacterium]